jgi:hypothetical protein
MSDWRFAADMKTTHGLVGDAWEGGAGKNSHLGNLLSGLGTIRQPRRDRRRGQTAGSAG